MVFYFKSFQLPCIVSDWKNHTGEIYELLAIQGNTRNDGYTYTACNNELAVTQEPITPANSHKPPTAIELWISQQGNTTYYTIDHFELVSTPAGDRIKVTLSA